MDPSIDDVLASSPSTAAMPSTNGSLSPDKTPTLSDSTQARPLNELEGAIPNAIDPQELIDRTLDFLASASNETLIGVLVALVCVIYAVFGRLGLLLIGMGAGVLLHASWEGSLSTGSSIGASTAPRKRQELALEVSQRLLDWPRQASAEHLTATVSKENKHAGVIAAPEDLTAADLEYATFRPATAAALRSFTDAVVTDYVKNWYEPILPAETVFPGSCRRTLTYFVTTVSSHVSRKRTEETFLQFLTNSSSIIIVFLNELAAAFTAVDSPSADASEVVEQYLKKSPESSLANVLSEEQQRKKFNMVADDVLSHFLDAKAYSCSPVRDFLREIFARLVLESTVISLSRPEFINEWIIYLLQDGESELMHAIDAGVEGARKQSVGGSTVQAESAISKATLPETNKTVTPRSTELPATHADRAEEEAMKEAKRLSALMASRGAQTFKENSKPEVIPRQEPQTYEAYQAGPTSENSYSVSLRTASVSETSDSQPLSPTTQTATLASPTARRESENQAVMLQDARVMIDDDGASSEGGIIKSRPTWDYLIQIEPASHRATGWMVFRKYADFQSLHEMISTVSRLNHIQSFSDQFPNLPLWKGKTRQNLARDLERYLQEALKHESLAETERMRRFMEKQAGPTETSPSKPGFSFPGPNTFENIGKDLLGALSNAPKGMAGGGRAVLDGVTGVFGGANHNRKVSNAPDALPINRRSSSRASMDLAINPGLANALNRVASPSIGSASIDPLASPRFSGEQPLSPIVSSSPPTSALGLGLSKDFVHIPPHKDMSNDATLPSSPLDASNPTSQLESKLALLVDENVRADPLDTVETHNSPKKIASLDSQIESIPTSEPHTASQTLQRPRAPITADETQIAVELIFAVINELYTLSSAWNIRRTLLNAAKTYILRPGSPTLETIRDLLQESMIDANSSDEALAEYISKIRENALPTEAELKAWPAPPSEEEKARLRETARRLFMQRGIPQALTSVMGAAASREALEKIFDSLQVESVARGFVFSLMLQALRVLTL
ncbi:Uncharacterized protein PECH_001853 [Penicillium ucsense]|uniref:PXA domain-containing protein n=1 Tax=Penicillium ucsense TaxID=2839758 RepID=A0A8J8WH79_9EURO|nr:Uncharacterized protein PECM_001986 [Penicillium ucsense]KAF7732231.1 Uncharacterized protein PECH_001853 [Penicillium ucsense]